MSVIIPQLNAQDFSSKPIDGCLIVSQDGRPRIDSPTRAESDDLKPEGMDCGAIGELG